MTPDDDDDDDLDDDELRAAIALQSIDDRIREFRRSFRWRAARSALRDLLERKLRHGRRR